MRRRRTSTLLAQAMDARHGRSWSRIRDAEEIRRRVARGRIARLTACLIGVVIAVLATVALLLLRRSG